MRSSFFEFNVAISGLFVARGALDTVAHNIANASTKGFSRQYAEIRATRPLMGFGRGMIGTGAEIFGVGQHRDFYLDKKYWSGNATLGQYSVKYQQLQLTESVMNELAGTGLSGQFIDFFKRMEDLTTAPGDTTYRMNLTSLSQSITTFFKNTYQTLQKQQRDINDEVLGVVTSINSIGDQLCTLNQQIYQYELDGSRANDLRDQRAKLIDELSTYVNVEVREIETNKAYAQGQLPGADNRSKSDKHFQVFINGQIFVNHYDYNSLAVVPRSEFVNGTQVQYLNNPEDANGLYDIVWAETGMELNMYSNGLSGELKGLIDLRDGNNGNFVRFASNPVYTASTANTPTTLTLKMNPPDRIDLSAAGGKITVKGANGQSVTLKYTGYTYDKATGNATFTLPGNLDTNTLATVNAANTTFTIGQTSDYKGIPYYISRLNTMARTFAMAINEGKYIDGTAIAGVIGHVDGFDLYNQNQRTLFFTYLDQNGNEARFDANFNIYNITAANFTVNKELLKDPKLLAASNTDTGGIDNGEVLKGLLSLNQNKSLFKEGALKDYIISIMSEMAVDVSQADRFEANYTDTQMRTDNQRMSVSGVSLNEEMTNMVRYQQLYQSAAKLINVIDAIYDTTINRMWAF